jgi:hypothetical protein
MMQVPIHSPHLRPPPSGGEACHVQLIQRQSVRRGCDRSASPVLFQQGSVVDPNVNYWMGSIAMDEAGNIALGFSASSDAVEPSVAVVGRTPNDPLGTMEAPVYLVNGTGVQIKSFKRWGDYSSMSVDPEDGCTFWYSQEYYKTTGAFNWNTRIASFKFPSCK